MNVWSSRPTPPPGTTVVEIESEECCTFEPVCGRKWDPTLAKPAFLHLSDGAWRDFANEMDHKVKRYRREGLGPAILGPTMFFGIILFHPAFGPLAMAIEDNEGEDSGEGEAPIGLALMMPILILSVVAMIWVQMTSRKFNQDVDAEIQQLLRRTSVGSGATFELATSWTQVCKPRGVRTYRGVYISPASSHAAPVVTGVPQYGVLQPAPVAQQTMLVTLPAGVRPGETVSIATPGGVQVQVVVPPGVAEGGQFQVALPAVPVVAVTIVPSP